MYIFELKLKNKTKKKTISLNFQVAKFYLYLIEDGSEFLWLLLAVVVFLFQDTICYEKFRSTKNIYCLRRLACDKKKNIIGIIYHCVNRGKTWRTLKIMRIIIYKYHFVRLTSFITSFKIKISMRNLYPKLSCLRLNYSNHDQNKLTKW